MVKICEVQQFVCFFALNNSLSAYLFVRGMHAKDLSTQLRGVETKSVRILTSCVFVFLSCFLDAGSHLVNQISVYFGFA